MSSIKDFSILGVLVLVGTIMSRLNLEVPNDLRVIDIIGGVAMIAGYVTARNLEVSKQRTVIYSVSSSIMAVVSVIAYKYSLVHTGPGMAAATIMLTLAYSIFFFAALVLGFGEKAMASK